MFVDLDYSKKIPKPNLFLAKPNKEIIMSLSDVEPNINYRVNDVDELTFQIPVLIEDNYALETLEIIKNPLVDLIKERYLILVEYKEKKEWFLIIKKRDVASESNDYIEIESYELAYELKDKDLVNYHTESSTIEQVMLGNNEDDTKGILFNTQWTLGYIDNKFKKIYREFTYDGTVLSAILELPNVFDCVIKYDTNEKLINIYHKDNFGRDTGIVFNHNKYLKSISKEKDMDKDVMCTRLRVIGKDGTSIEGVNPTGKDYIDDFTYFMYPFKMNKRGEIIKHSFYMSDDLCIALVDYKIKILQYKSNFRNLITNKDTYGKVKIYKDQELNRLKTELNIFNDKLVVARSSGNSIEEIQNIKRQIQNDINNKKQELELIKDRLKDINKEIDEIRDNLREKNNFTNKQLEELYRFVLYDRVEVQTSDEIELYKIGLKKLKEKSKPKVNISIDLVDFMNCIEEQHMWDKLELGDKIRVQYPLLNIDEKIKYGIENDVLNEEGDI